MNVKFAPNKTNQIVILIIRKTSFLKKIKNGLHTFTAGKPRGMIKN